MRDRSHEGLQAGEVADASHAFALRLLRSGEAEVDVIFALREAFDMSSGRAGDVLTQAARRVRAERAA